MFFCSDKVEGNWESFSSMLGNHIESGALLRQNIQEKCGALEADLAKIGPSSKVHQVEVSFVKKLDAKPFG